MKFLSFNINGLRAHFQQLVILARKHEPDVIALQETKVHNDSFPKDILANILDYNIFYYGQKSHYGVALLTKTKTTKVTYGFPGVRKDSHRRVIIADVQSEFGIIKVINGYFPQGENRNNSIKFKEKIEVYSHLKNFLKKETKKEFPVVVMGDMNISTTNLDIGISEVNRKRWIRTGKCSFLPEERQIMNELLDWGLVDTFRHIHPDIQDRFSWFDYRSNGFKENRGLRVDLILASKMMIKYCVEAGIDYSIRKMKKTSDHTAVWTLFKKQ